MLADYTDDEGDAIVIDADPELQEFPRYCAKHNTHPKLHISIRDTTYEDSSEFIDNIEAFSEVSNATSIKCASPRDRKVWSIFS